MHANLFTRLPLLPIFSAKASLSLSKFEERRRQKEEEEEEEKTLLGASLPPRFGAKNLEAFVEGGDRVFGGGARSWNSHAQNVLNNYSTSKKFNRQSILFHFTKKPLGIFRVQQGCGGGVVDQKFF